MIIFEKNKKENSIPGNIIPAHNDYFNTGDTYSPIVLKTAKDVKINTEGIILKDYKILEEFMLADYKNQRFDIPTKIKIFALLVTRQKIKLNNEYLWLCETSRTNYYHWTIDVLIKIIGLHKIYKILPELLIPRIVFETNFVVESIKYWKIPYVIIDKDLTYQVAQIITPITQNRQRIFNLQNLLFFRERFFSGLSRNKIAFRNIYISREKASKRKIRNEDEIILLLEKYKFEIYCTEDLEYSEQIRLFSEAKTIVSIHGAALVNQIYMLSGGTIIELRHPDFTNQPLCFYDLASAIGHKYFYLTGIPESNKTAHWENIYVQTEKLSVILKTA